MAPIIAPAIVVPMLIIALYGPVASGAATAGLVVTKDGICVYWCVCGGVYLAMSIVYRCV